MFKIARRIMIYIPILLVAVGLVLFTISPPAGNSQKVSAAPLPTPTNVLPPFSAYRGVTINMSTEEVRAKLGQPKDASDATEYYVQSENEYIQVFYEAKKVTALTVTFSGNLAAAPDCKAVFGERAEPKPDGGIFKMVHYPKAGFWVSYNKIVGDEPMVMIAIKKI